MTDSAFGSRNPVEAAGVTWSRVSNGLGRNYLPAALFDAVAARDLTDPAEIMVGLADAWTGCEWPARYVHPDLWLLLFGSVLSPGEYIAGDTIASQADLPETIRLYRGAAPRHKRGMSWTDDIDQARWFADRFRERLHSRLYRIEATREMVLARFPEDRNEAEWVLHPRLVASSRIDAVREEIPPAGTGGREILAGDPTAKGTRRPPTSSRSTADG